MNLEQTLRDELHAVGETVVPPPAPDPATLAREARMSSTRAWVRSAAGVVLAAAAVLAIIFVGNRLGDPTSEQTPAPQPTGTATGAPSRVSELPKVPYLWQDALYAGGTRYDGHWSALLVHGRSAVAVSNNRNTDTSTIVVFRDGRRVDDLHGMPYLQSPVLSPSGDVLAYIEVAGSQAHLVVRDLETRKILGRLLLDPAHVTGDQPGLLVVDGVDDDGTAHYGYNSVGYYWTPPQGYPLAEARRNAWAPQLGFPAQARGVEMNARGPYSWGAWLQAAPGATSVPDGGHAATLRAFRRSARDQLVVIRLPEVDHTFARSVVWETGRTLLVLMQTDTGTHAHLIRCDIVTKRCKDVPPPTTG